MSPKRPPSIMGDDERVAIGAAARLSPVPFEIDPEITPPPSEPPDITAFDGFDTLAPEVREPLLALHHAQRELDVGLGRLWDARKVPGELAQLAAAVQKILLRTDHVEEFTRAVNHHAGQLHRAFAWIEARSKTDDRLALTLEGLDRRLDAVEREYVGFNATLTAAAASIRADVASMVRSLEVERTERIAAQTALETRMRSLEDTRTRARGAMWILGIVVTFVAAAAGFLGHAIKDWLVGAQK